MCGICGVLSTPGVIGGEDKSLVEQMKAAISHRGPDGNGSHIGRYSVLGHQRLAIIDLEHGKQPMLSPCGRYAIVFNGEIYNYLEIRQQLIQQGQQFKTFSDTEVLLKLLICFGKEALHKLNGMFAFCFIDLDTGKWLMARDQFGIKPLYYVLTKTGKIVFASEIKALLCSEEVKATINQTALNHYFTFQFCLNDETLFNDIKKIEAGFYIQGHAGKIDSINRYWDADYSVDHHHTEAFFVEKLHSLLEDSVKLQVRSDVPVGCYLSGGLDSSIVTCLASNFLDYGVPVFTGKFDESPAYDESNYARQVAAQTRSQFNEIAPTAEDFVTFLPEIIRMLDEPVAGPGVFPQFMVSKLASEQVKVVLGGQGGDEIFGGYARYLVGYLEQALKGAIYETQEEGKYLVGLDSIIPNLPVLKQYSPLMKNFFKEGLFDEMDSRYFRLIDRSPDLRFLLTDDAWNTINSEHVFNEFSELFNHPDTLSYINKMTHFDFKTLLPALLHVEDRMSMSVSIESRVPFLDTRIMELVASAPPAMKFKGGETKALLKKVVGNIVPASIIERKDKMGFPVPLNEWMQGGQVRDYVNDIMTSQACRNRGLYNMSSIQNMLDNQGVGSRQLWGALSLELWHQIYIDQ